MRRRQGVPQDRAALDEREAEIHLAHPRAQPPQVVGPDRHARHPDTPFLGNAAARNGVEQREALILPLRDDDGHAARCDAGAHALEQPPAVVARHTHAQ